MKKDLNEQLNKSKFLMGYDFKKTLIENKDAIEEQAVAPQPVPQSKPAAQPAAAPQSKPAAQPAAAPTSNVLTDVDLMGNTNKIRSYLQMISDYSTLGLPNLTDILGFNVGNTLAGRRTGVKGAVDALDGWVDSKDLTYLLSLITALKGKVYVDDTQDPPVTVPAIKRFLELYSEDEGGNDLISDVESVGTRTLPAGTDKIKAKIINTINSMLGETATQSQETSPADGGQKVKYGPCANFPFAIGCGNKAIGEIQQCLGLKVDNYFGPVTSKALIAKGFDGQTITKEIYDKIKTTMCGSGSGTDRLSQLSRLIKYTGNVAYVKNKLSTEDYQMVNDYLGKAGYAPTTDPEWVKKYMANHVWVNPKISQTVEKVNQTVQTPQASTTAPQNNQIKR